MTPQELQKQIDDTDRKIAATKDRIRAADEVDHDTGALEKQLDDLEDKAQALGKAALLMPGVKSRHSGEGGKVLGFHTGWATLDHGIDKANQNPNLFLYRLQSSAYKYSWALIPISTPLVWLLFFWRRDYKVYDHLVFVTFSLTFMMLLVTLLTVLGAIGLGTGWILAVALILPPVHIYRQLRGAYLCGRVSALLRTVLLVMTGCVALILYLLLLLGMGVFH